MEASDSGNSLQPGLRHELETIAERMDCGRGTWTLELIFQDGDLVKWFRKEGPVPAAALARFEGGAEPP